MASSSSPPSPALAFASSLSTTRLVILFSLLVTSCAIGLISMASFVQPPSTFSPSSLHRLRTLDSADQDPQDAYTVLKSNRQAYAQQLMDTGGKRTVQQRWAYLNGSLDDYACVGWRQTRDCSPAGPREPEADRPCSASVENGASGYCEILDLRTNQTKRVLEMHCDSTRPGVAFKCEDFKVLLSYGRKAVDYIHDPQFSFSKCQENLVQDQQKAGLSKPKTQNASTSQDSTDVRTGNQTLSFERGIVIVVYERVLESVYASIRSLRAMGCTLPVELWYLASETDVHHPLLQNLTREHNAFVREITDTRISRFYTKLHAVFYSAFDQVLLLDADNFAVRDPTYLFYSPEFRTNKAIFWPDFWRFRKTIFNIQPTSLVWDVLDLDVVDMFEQESGQVLIDRRSNLQALNVMMYYATHADLIEDLRLVWGDKDLFRFAFLKADRPFHMIAAPPGSAGVKLADRNVFCGVTMVQHDPKHQVLFFHRNMEKLASDNRRMVWQDLQDFKMGEVSLDEYDVRGANGGRYYPQFARCYGKDIYYENAFTVTPIAGSPYADLEPRLLRFAEEAERIVNATITVSSTSDAKQMDLSKMESQGRPFQASRRCHVEVYEYYYYEDGRKAERPLPLSSAMPAAATLIAARRS